MTTKVTDHGYDLGVKGQIIYMYLKSVIGLVTPTSLTIKFEGYSYVAYFLYVLITTELTDYRHILRVKVKYT